MMSIGNKEEVGAQGQRLDEPNIGVPIKKRPFQLTNPGSLGSGVPYIEKFALTSKHFTPKSPLDFPLSGFDPGNPSPDLNKPAGVAMNPLHDFNTVDMGRNYCMLKNKEKLDQCSTDLSLTGPSSTVSSSKPCFNKPSYDLSYDNMESRSVFDLNVPTSETWDSNSSTDVFPFNNSNFAHTHTQPVEALAKQGNISRMIPNGVVSGNNLMLEKSYEKCNVNEVTLDLQLKLPPRPELRMKNMEPVCSSDLSLSLSGKDLNTIPEPVNVNVKPRMVESSQKTINEDNNTDPIVKPVPQNQVIVKQESHEVIVPEKNVQANGLKLKDQSLASGSSVVKKEPMDKLDKPPSSGNDLRLEKQAEKITETSNLTKGIDLNFATPLPDASNVDQTANNPVPAKSAVSDHIVQHENVDNRKVSSHKPSLASTSSSPLVGTEDIKPVIFPSASPTNDNNKKKKKMASDGMSQGSADMDCSEGNTLPKSAATCKTLKNNTTNDANALSSCSSITKIPKQEVGTFSEFERGENVKGSDGFSSLTVKENHQIQNNENDIPSSSTKAEDMPDKIIQGVSLEINTAAGGSKLRSPSSSMSRRDKEVDQSSERENGNTSSRQTEENNISLHRRFKRADSSPNREYFERKKSRVPSWNEGSNIHSNRGQRWEGQRCPQFDGDRFENEDNSNQRAAGFAMANRKRQTNRFNSRFGHSNYNKFRFTRTHSNPDMNFDEGNDGRNIRPHPRFQNRSRFADVSPRGMEELESPVFEHPNSYKRGVDHAMHERSSSPGPGPRRGMTHQWTTPSGEMIGGHSDRRPFFKKENFNNRRHASPPFNRVHSFGRGRGGRGRGTHWNNNGRPRFDVGAPQAPAADVHDMEPYGDIHCQGGGEMMPFHARFTDNDGAYHDNRVRNRPREAGNPDEFRFNNRAPRAWRDNGNTNNNGDKLKRRRY